MRSENWHVGGEEVMVTSDVLDIPQSLPRACNRVLLSAKRVSLVEVSAVIVTAWLADAHVLVLCPVHSRLDAVRLDVELLTYVPATEYRSPDHVGRVIRCQRTKEVAACCVTCAFFSWDCDTIW